MPELILKTKVFANSATTQLVGWQDPVLEVRVQAPLRDGRADEKLCRFLAAFLEVPLASVSIETGYWRSLKTVKIVTADPTRCLRRLGFPESGEFVSSGHSMTVQL
jgi:uncharacterized protein YggU (UPF0235/DUF167 family)